MTLKSGPPNRAQGVTCIVFVFFLLISVGMPWDNMPMDGLLPMGCTWGVRGLPVGGPRPSHEIVMKLDPYKSQIMSVLTRRIGEGGGHRRKHGNDFLFLFFWVEHWDSGGALVGEWY